MTKEQVQERFDRAVRRLQAAGDKVSVGSWIDYQQNRFYVFSVRTIPGTYGHPAVEATESWSGGLLPEDRNDLVFPLWKRDI